MYKKLKKKKKKKKKSGPFQDHRILPNRVDHQSFLQNCSDLFGQKKKKSVSAARTKCFMTAN